MNTKLHEMEWQFAFEAVLHLNSCTSLSEFAELVLDRVATMIPCEKSVFLAQGPLSKIAAFALRGFDDSQAESIISEDFDVLVHPLSVAASHELKTERDSSFLPRNLADESPTYRRLSHEFEIEYALRTFLVENRNSLGYIALFRTSTDIDFDAKNQKVMELLSPHISQKLSALLLAQEGSLPYCGLQISESLIAKYHLSKREAEIAAMIGSSMSDAELAESLYISVSTLKKHLVNIYRKVGVNSRMKLLNRLNEG